MFPLSRFRFLSLAVVSLVAGVAAARTPDALAPRVRLSVFNDAGIPADTLAQAAARATAILAQSGVELDWLNCGRPDPSNFSQRATPCSFVGWPYQLSVRILRRGRFRRGLPGPIRPRRSLERLLQQPCRQSRTHPAL